MRQTDEREVAQSSLRQSEERVRHMTAEALRQSQEQLRLLIDSVKDYAILMLDPKGMMTTWSKGAEHIKGYRPEEIIGQHFSQFYSPQDVAQGKPQRELETAVTEGRFEVDGWRLRKDGTAFWAEVVIAPIYDAGGKLTGFSKVTRDATERMRYETALQEKNGELQIAVKELDAFSYSVSHDLRTPLRAIDGFNRIVLKQYGSILPADARDYLLLVRDNTVQMGHLIGRLAQVLTARTSSAEQAAGGDSGHHRGSRRRRKTAGQWPIRQRHRRRDAGLWGDPALIKQVFANLIQNAFKYTRKRAQAVIEIGSSEIGGERVFFVRDNGAGFDMAICRQAVRRVPTTASRRGVRRYRRGLGDRAAHHRAPWWPHLGRSGGRQRRNILLHHGGPGPRLTRARIACRRRCGAAWRSGLSRAGLI